MSEKAVASRSLPSLTHHAYQHQSRYQPGEANAFDGDCFKLADATFAFG